MGAVSAILFTARTNCISLLVLDSPFPDFPSLLKYYFEKVKVTLSRDNLGFNSPLRSFQNGLKIIFIPISEAKLKTKLTLILSNILLKENY